jgi:phosphatidylinositol alpha-1,6-mannosyltransferase
VQPRVLFVSKPIAPPFHDGTKCLVRDVARHLERALPVVMSSKGAPPLEAAPGYAPIEAAPVYPDAGRFTPGLTQNLRAATWLLSRSRADVWHFVFAPNPRTSAVGRFLRRARGVPVVQTIASPPRSFDGIERLLFGDIVVAQSRWTRDRIPGGQTRVIPPPVGPIAERGIELQRAVRRELDVSDDARLFVYPGDLETSGGAESVARVVGPLVAELPQAVVVFAYRAKSPRAEPIARELRARLDPAHVRFTSELDDVLALIAASAVVLFPVDDLWGKVDLPIVLLESMVLGVPVVALDYGPLSDLEGAVLVPAGDDRALVRAAIELADNPAQRARVIEAQRDAIQRRHRAEVVAKAYEELYLEVSR